jgi:hypothetical protein
MPRKRSAGPDKAGRQPPKSPLYTPPKTRVEKLELVLELGRDSDGAFRLKNRKDTKPSE